MGEGKYIKTPENIWLYDKVFKRLISISAIAYLITSSIKSVNKNSLLQKVYYLFHLNTQQM